MKNQKGITLVALVVTIVVLLILAGITIMYVLSDDGIFGTATESRIRNEMGAVSDYAGQAQATYMMEYFSATSVDASTGASFDKAGKAETAVTNNFAGTGFTLANGTYTSSDNGRITGSVEVTGQYDTYTVTFTKGVVKVTSSDKTGNLTLSGRS